MLVKFPRRKSRPNRPVGVSRCAVGSKGGGGDRCGKDRDTRKAWSANSVAEQSLSLALRGEFRVLRSTVSPSDLGEGVSA